MLINRLEESFVLSVNLLIKRYFCKVYDNGEKEDLSKTYWNLKLKI